MNGIIIPSGISRSLVHVFLTNMRPFELEKFGLNYDSLSQLNPKLIYASLTGLGKKGSERNAPGYDQPHREDPNRQRI